MRHSRKKTTSTTTAPARAKKNNGAEGAAALGKKMPPDPIVRSGEGEKEVEIPIEGEAKLSDVAGMLGLDVEAGDMADFASAFGGIRMEVEDNTGKRKAFMTATVADEGLTREKSE